MRDFLIFLPITAFFLALRSTLFQGLPIPDLPLIAVFYIAYSRPSLAGLVLSFALGYIDDVFSGAVIGSTSLSLVLVFAFVHLLTKKVHFSTAGMMALGAAVMALLKSTAIYMILSSFSSYIPFLAYTLPTVFLTGLFAPAFIALFSRLSVYKAPHTPKGGLP